MNVVLSLTKSCQIVVQHFGTHPLSQPFAKLQAVAKTQVEARWYRLAKSILKGLGEDNKKMRRLPTFWRVTWIEGASFKEVSGPTRWNLCYIYIYIYFTTQITKKCCTAMRSIQNVNWWLIKHGKWDLSNNFAAQNKMPDIPRAHFTNEHK